MARQKRSKKKSKHRSSTREVQRGFDFGDRKYIIAVADTSFQQALIDAQIVACGYGYDQPTGFPGPIPLLTLVATNEEPVRQAFEEFKRWGCEHDGDVVDMNLLLKKDGTYEMRIAPEADRAMFRLVRQADLYHPLMMHAWWVKPFDSTHPMLRELKRYCDSTFHPISISAGMAPKSGNPADIKPIQGLPQFIKFDLQIVDEESVLGDPRFFFRNKGRKRPRGLPGPKLTPEDLCLGRRKLFDVAFPVSRERVRRSGLVEEVRTFPLFEAVSETQIVQASINLILSDELVGGDRHYTKAGQDLQTQIWKHIDKRLEMAVGENLGTEIDASAVAHQLELDVRYALALHKISTESKPFSDLQERFRRDGYIDD
ncbi:MAG: hypothetical protein AABM67_07660 [Acidobacteriota bacterium]